MAKLNQNLAFTVIDNIFLSVILNNFERLEQDLATFYEEGKFKNKNFLRDTIFLIICIF